MADEEVKEPEAPVETAKSPQELAAEAKAKEEERRKNQVEFDPKVHGVGTTPIPVNRPSTVKELTDFVLKMESRITSLENATKLE